MGFSKKIKEAALVASARRCSICKEFLGRKIEVHHIIPISEGGEDTFENAIPLCFNCHADAGHYNSKHPRGIKYSQSELIKHRDNWYKIINEGSFSTKSSKISQQYYICNSLDMVWEIINGDFNNFPINHIKVLQNELFNFLKKASKYHNNKYREDLFGNDEYEIDMEEYEEKIKKADKKVDEYGNIFYNRSTTIEELKELFSDKDFIIDYMIKNGADVGQISNGVSYHEDGCVGGWLEKYFFREVKTVFLSLMNKTNNSIYLSSISEIHIQGEGFIKLEDIKDEESVKSYNNLEILSGEALLIPICITLEPQDSNNNYNVGEQLMSKGISTTSQSQDVRLWHQEELTQHPTIGPRNIIKLVEFNSENSSDIIDIKGVDLNNLLLISRFWEFGSCPHIFIQQENSEKWVYLGELFSSNPKITQSIKFNFEKLGLKDVSKIKICEIEMEITRINEIFTDGILIKRDIILEKDEEIIIDVVGKQEILFNGYYELFENIDYVRNNRLKRQKIQFYTVDMNYFN